MQQVDLGNLLAYVSVGDRERDLERLVAALADIRRRYKRDKATLMRQEYISPQVVAGPQEAFYAEKESLPLRALNVIFYQQLFAGKIADFIGGDAVNRAAFRAGKRAVR